MKKQAATACMMLSLLVTLAVTVTVEPGLALPGDALALELSEGELGGGVEPPDPGSVGGGGDVVPSVGSVKPPCAKNAATRDFMNSWPSE